LATYSAPDHSALERSTLHRGERASARVPTYRESLLVFAVCAFAVYNWSLLQFSEKVPGWLFYLTIWDVLGILAYSLVFALLESGLVVGALWLLAAILPTRFLRERFVAVGVIVVLVTAAFAILAHLNDNLFRQSSLPMLLLWGLIYLGTIAIASFLLARSGRLQSLAMALAERLSVLLIIYLPVSLLSLIVVVVRNLRF
jgi:hypothetical protein